MCRFTFYLGPRLRVASLLTDPEHSLIHQSFDAREREEPLNGDGFGLAWYAPGHTEPALFRSVTPAWSNRNLRDLARVVESGCILAHVRAATQGLDVSESNCHPFRRGRYAFMHNGDVGGFSDLRRAILNELSDRAFRALEGTTDSEHFFALLMDSVRELEACDVDAMAGAFERALSRLLEIAAREGVEEPTYLNVALTDGERAVVSRFTTDAAGRADTLYVSAGRAYTCAERECLMVQPGEGGGAVLVSSEPLSADAGWEAVPVNHLVLVAADRTVRVRAVEV